jgi:hypothetical protein
MDLSSAQVSARMKGRSSRAVIDGTADPEILRDCAPGRMENG